MAAVQNGYGNLELTTTQNTIQYLIIAVGENFKKNPFRLFG
jgi:hypothetical protein